jgi:hypothetical protein
LKEENRRRNLGYYSFRECTEENRRGLLQGSLQQFLEKRDEDNLIGMVGGRGEELRKVKSCIGNCVIDVIMDG